MSVQLLALTTVHYHSDSPYDFPVAFPVAVQFFSQLHTHPCDYQNYHISSIRTRGLLVSAFHKSGLYLRATSIN